ncbi:hypothetical protein [Nocardia vinacea]|uniref:hypothetical protein n=1 Tax=Nocardia vinacea TaxID=96468 RepID=UPI0003075493|nr:hypothetical protein [Nocardia vinacea]
MQASPIQWGMLAIAIVMAIFAAGTLHINYRKHRVEVRARGSKTIRRRREKVDEYAAEVERLGDSCPQALTLEHDLACRWLAAEYAVQMTPEEIARQWRMLTRAFFPIVFVTVVSYQFFDSSLWIRVVAGVLYWIGLAWSALTWIALKNPSWRVDRQRMLYARLGDRAVLPQIRPVTGNPLVARVPNWRAVDRWIVETTGRPTDIVAVTDEHVRTIQASIDQWYTTRRTHRVRQSLAAFGRKVRDRATDPVRLR